MRIIFITDLHFGVLTPNAVDTFLKMVKSNPPDLIVIGGDFTQRAFHSQYKQARAFLDQLPCQWIAVPGNHDVPAWNMLDRLVTPFRLYKKYISEDTNSVFQNDQIIIAGINSACRIPHDNVWEQGKITNAQLDHIRSIFAKADLKLLKAVVVHHPVVFLAQGPEKLRVNNYAAALKTFKDCGVDLILTGHLHRTSAQLFDNMVCVQGGTSFSNRQRDEVNQFFEITLQDKKIELNLMRWSDRSFGVHAEGQAAFVNQSGIWTKAI